MTACKARWTSWRLLCARAKQGFQQLQLTNAPEIAKVSDDPLRAAIAVQEAKVRLAESELSPLPLKAPIDGIVTVDLSSDW